jgi:hypothetical protein
VPGRRRCAGGVQSTFSDRRLHRTIFRLELGELRWLETVATPHRPYRSIRRQDEQSVLAFIDDDVVAGPIAGQRHAELALGFHLPQCGIRASWFWGATPMEA